MFQGADVDELDTLARRTTEAADFADDVVVALRIVVAALKAMSWTGWAAAFAAYLEGVVIPWVQATGRYLRTFASILALTSSEQKQVSGDLPQVTLPAGSWTSPTYPTQSAVVAPRISTPDVAPVSSHAGGGALGGGATTAAPAPLGQVSDVRTGATGGGASVTTPGGGPVPTGEPWVGSPRGPVDGAASDLGRPGLDGVAMPLAGAGSAPGGGVGTGSGADDFGPTGQGTAGPGTGGPSAGGPGTGGLDAGGRGAAGPAEDRDGVAGGSTASGAGGRHAPVSVTALPIGATGAELPDAGRPPLPATGDGTSFTPALAAAPLGLAGVGAAAAGAVRSAARRAALEDPEAVDVATSLHDLLPGASRQEPAS